MVGAICFGESHCNKEDSQKRVVMPSPRVMVIAVAKRRRSSSLHGMGMPTQGLSLSVHSCHNQRSRKTRANFLDPRSLGRQDGWVGKPSSTRPCISLPQFGSFRSTGISCGVYQFPQVPLLERSKKINSRFVGQTGRA